MGWSSGLSLEKLERVCLQYGDLGSIPRLGRSPGERNGNPLQYSCLRSPLGYSSRDCKEWDTTERLHFHFSLSREG